MCAGHQLHAGHHRALPRDRRVGAHGDPLRRDRAAGARRAAGLLAAARRDAAATRSPRRSPSAPCTRSRSSSTGPTRRTSTARCSASCSPASSGSSACAPTRWASPRPAWWPRPSSGRSSRRTWTARRPWFNYEEFAEKLEPTKAEAFSWTHSYGPLTLVARRARAAAHQGHGAGLLEGDQPRRVRRRALARGRRRRATPLVRAAPEPHAGCRPSRSSTAGCARRSSSAPATSQDILPGRLAPGAAAERRHLRDLDQAAAPGRQLPGAGLRPAPERHPAQALGHQLPRLHPGLPRAAGAAARRAPPASWTRRPGGRWAPTPDMRFAAYGTDGGAGVVWPSGFGVQQDGDSVMADSPYAQLYALTQQIRREHEVALRLRAGRPGSRAAGDDLRREPAAAPLPAGGLPLRHQDRLLPAVLRRDGAHAAHGRHPRPRRLGLQPRQLQQRAQGLRGARHRRALVGRGLLPALRLDHLRPDARRVAGQLAARRRRRRAPTAGRRCRRTSAGAWASRATARSRPATPAPTSRRPAGAAAGSCPSAPALVGPPGARSAASRCGAGARRSPRSRPSWPSCSARCTAPGATRRPT